MTIKPSAACLGTGLLFAGLSLLAALPSARAEEVLTLPDDVYFVWHPVPVNPGNAAKQGIVGSCGFGIFGNHTSRKEPRVEYDLNVDEIFRGDDKIVGVSAGTFNMVGGKRVPRAAITAIAFTFEGKEGSVDVEIVGAPNASNGIRGMVPLEKAGPLLDALQVEKYLTISFKYADGSADAVRIRGFRDRDRGTPNAVFTRCTHGNPPKTSGPYFPVR